ncbi:MAG: DEAD/DEAH box helicase, partial [Planctomycetota bacterium]|nr:DEAD/DEAH box helicase [Planctomycetota bacterium]
MSSLTELKGIGPVVAARLQEAGYANVADLALAFPARYRSVHGLVEPSAALAGSEVSLRGRCVSASVRWMRGRRGGVTVARFDAGGARIEASFFGRSWLARQLPAGKEAVLSGTLRQDGAAWKLDAPRIGFDVDAFEVGARLESVYPKIDGVGAVLFKNAVSQALELALPQIHETLDAAVLETHGLMAMPAAVAHLHVPVGDGEQLERARRRLALFEAEALLQGVRDRRERRAGLKAWPVVCDAEVEARIRARLPFEPSPEQEACIGDLAVDLARAQPMARLLQGDVGTGKTLVAFWAALAATAAGLKAVVLAPTEMLAEQHADQFRDWMRGARLPVVLVTQSAEKTALAGARKLLAAADPCLVVGTHALLSNDLDVSRLGLLVIDEQHRFGVEQRGKLARERDGCVPHVLVMSATPIPRTLATALWGDLDLSEIRQPPIERAPVTTRILDKEVWPRVRDGIVAEVERGGRVFVVCPRIGEVDAGDDGAAATFDELRALVPTAMAHGRQQADERRRAQHAFCCGEAGCLVATTLVEVGVDVPGATWMVVRDAERLGLATLHQLRGRVGRGGQAATCILLAGPDTDRLQVLVDTNDGFAIAEADLRERGPGELTGRLQHGRREVET